MMDDLQAGRHLDAEQMNAFAEGAVSPQERTASLAHLAHCALCRQVLFVAQQALVAEAPQPMVVRASWRERLGSWFGPVPVAVAGLCAVLLLVAVVRVRRSPQPEAPTVARESAPQPPFVAPEVPAVLQPTTPAAGARKTLPPPPRRSMAEPPPPPPPAAKQPPPVMPPSVGRSVGMASGAFALRAPAPSAPLPVQVQQPVVGPTPPVALAMNARRAPVPLSASPAAPADGGAPLMAEKRNYVVGQAAGAGVGAPGVAGGMSLNTQPGALPAGAMSEVSGLVTDPSGAPVAGALVTLRPATGQNVRSTRSDAGGRYRLSALAAGGYTVEIAKPGFSTESRTVTVGTHDQAQLNSVLPVGSAAATEAVVSSAAELQTMDATSLASDDRIALQASLKAKTAAPLRIAKLPSGLATRLSAVHGTTLLGVDSADGLFVSQDLGEHWKRVEAAWRGTIQKLVLVPGETPEFQLTTASGEVWSSVDGRHWRKI